MLESYLGCHSSSPASQHPRSWSPNWELVLLWERRFLFGFFLFLFLLALLFFGYTWKPLAAKLKALQMSRGEGFESFQKELKTQAKCTEPIFPWEAGVPQWLQESRAFFPGIEVQGWSMRRHRWCSKIARSEVPWSLSAPQTKTAGAVHTASYFHFNWMNYISLTKTVRLAKLNAAQLHSQRPLGSKWLLSLVEESKPNPCPWQNAHQLQWSQDFTRVCPQKENREEMKISAANFSTAKMSLFWRAEGQFLRSLHLLWWAKWKWGGKAAPFQRVISDNSFLAGGKIGLIHVSYFTSPRHIREQPLYCFWVSFQLYQLQTKPLVSVNASFNWMQRITAKCSSSKHLLPRNWAQFPQWDPGFPFQACPR